MDNDEVYQEAKQRVHEIKRFYSHLGAYVVVNIVLFAINMITVPETLWFYWPLLGWGVGLAAHGLRVFVRGGVLGKGWERRKLREFVAKERAKEEEREERDYRYLAGCRSTSSA